MKNLDLWKNRQQYASRIFFYVLFIAVIKTFLPQENIDPVYSFYLTGILDATLLVLLVTNVITLFKEGYSLNRSLNVIIHLVMFICISYMFLNNKFI